MSTTDRTDAEAADKFNEAENAEQPTTSVLPGEGTDGHEVKPRGGYPASEDVPGVVLDDQK